MTPRGPFVGRAEFVRRIESLFEEDERLITIVGVGGVGKSRLAREIASRAASAIVVDVHEAESVEAFADALAESAAVRDASGAAAFERIGVALAARGELLLVIDGLDQLVVHGPETIGCLLEHAAELRVLATSRERLALEGELVCELPPLTPDRDAIELLRALADRAGRPASDDAALVEIARATDGIPLALELAASRLSVMGARALAHRLTSGLDVLRRNLRGGAARHTTLESTVEWSWNLLRPFERDALAQCSVFRGGFSLEAAEAVIDLSRNPGAPSVLDAIASLRDRSLLRATEHPHGSHEIRLGSFDCVRVFAQQKLEESGLRDASLERHTRFFVESAESWAAELGRGATVQARRRLVVERDNLLAIVERVMAMRPVTASSAEPALRVLLALAPVLLTRGPLPLYVKLLDPAVESMRGSGADPKLLARALALRGELRHRRGDPDPLTDMRLAVLLAEKIGEPTLELDLAYRTAKLAAEQGDLETSRRYHTRAVALRADDEALEWPALFALLHRDRERARDLYERALQQHEAKGNLVEAVSCRLRLGELSLLAGSLSDAQVHLGAAESMASELDDSVTLASVHGYFGFARHLAGDLPIARQTYEDVTRALEEIGALAVAARFSGLLGVLASEDGRTTEAHARLSDMIPRERDATWLAFFRGTLRALDAAEIHEQGVPAFDRLLERVRRARPEGPAIVVSDALVAPADGDWFRMPSGRPVSLRNRKPLRRLLSALLDARIEYPGESVSQAALVAASWPDERVLADAASQRLRVAISTLRRLGLRDALVTAENGYLLDPNLRTHVVRQ